MSTPHTVIRFPAPGPLINANHRRHWRARAQETRLWRNATNLHTYRHLGPPTDAGRPPSLVVAFLPVPDNRRRDPHNYYPTIKAIIDGLVDAGVWPDDNPTYVTTAEPQLRAGLDEVIVELHPWDITLQANAWTPTPDERVTGRAGVAAARAAIEGRGA